MYRLDENSVTRLSDGASIPFADGNMDYREYLAWLADGNTPEPTPIPTLDALKARKLADINAEAQKAIEPYTRGYPKFEIDTWPVQHREADAYQLDPAASTPFCDYAAQQRGISREEFISKVMAKVALFTQVSATVAGYRQYLEDQIHAVTNPDTGPAALDAIIWVSPV